MICAQDYPRPLNLVIYRSGLILHEVTPEFGIFWDWAFLAKGLNFAACKGFSHGTDLASCAPYDTNTGRKVPPYVPGEKHLPG